MSDYYLLRRTNLNINELYSANPLGDYYTTKNNIFSGSHWLPLKIKKPPLILLVVASKMTLKVASLNVLVAILVAFLGSATIKLIY